MIRVRGGASSKVWELFPKEDELDKNLLDFLRDHGFSVASSCSGKKQCRKCVFSDGKLSCEKRLSCEESVRSLLGQEVVFDYM